ncbi:hypothetical protein PN441_12245 [Spirulina major CS-329]|jgi:hypothetical protein|uniref:hypothetical protein n=1 Tax=Spirulina TaxID=1154 RepID=UPI00232A8CCA|nr:MULTISPECIES: hypothetical protein [Spirulina]MDB9493923.1 hypothetical protein [Spirulina subsalsa CS-330]MDB9503843.1 hypothetical protein [Spirulina major CS-329]
MDIPQPLLQNLILYLSGRRAAHDAEAESLLKQLTMAMETAEHSGEHTRTPASLFSAPPGDEIGC